MRLTVHLLKRRQHFFEAIQERSVTVSGKKCNLPIPFLFWQHKPIEQRRYLSLPEAQLDRFMFNVFLDYPSFEEGSG